MGLGFSILGPLSSTLAQDDYTEDSDDHIEESLTNYRKENQKLVESIQRTHGNGTKGAMPKLDMSPDKLRPLITQVNSMYSRMSYEASRAQIAENISKSPAKGMTKVFPKSVDFITHLLRDNRALLYLLDMFKDKKKLLFFFLANLFTFILGFILVRMSSKESSMGKRLIRYFFRKLFIYGLRIFILIFFFGTELAPTFNIFKEVFL